MVHRQCPVPSTVFLKREARSQRAQSSARYVITILPPPGWRFFGEGLAGGLSEQHDQGIEEIIREELQGACGDVISEADLGGSGEVSLPSRNTCTPGVEVNGMREMFYSSCRTFRWASER